MGLIGYRQETTEYSALATSVSKYERFVPKRIIQKIDAFLAPWHNALLEATGSYCAEEAEGHVQYHLFQIREHLLKSVAQARKNTQLQVLETECQASARFLDVTRRQWMTYDVERGYR